MSRAILFAFALALGACSNSPLTACDTDADCPDGEQCVLRKSGLSACSPWSECPSDPVSVLDCPLSARPAQCATIDSIEDVCEVSSGILATACPPMCADPNGAAPMCAISTTGTTCCRDGVCK